MPELPEVETVVRDLRHAKLIGRQIVRAEVQWPRTIATSAAEEFCAQIAGQTIQQIERRAKFIVLTLSSDTLLVHLRMTGKFTFQPKQSHVRVCLSLDDGRLLHYEDQRKFGRLYLTKNPELVLARLGLEPLSEQFTLQAFTALCQQRKTQVKPFLLNQTYVAGLGNIYADEALWESQIHPQTLVHTLTSQQIKLLHQAIVTVLQRGIAYKGTTLGKERANYSSVSGRKGSHQHRLAVFRRQGKPCPRCCTEIVKTIVVQRGTHLCPNCQKRKEQKQYGRNKA